jgi:DNA processing protein
MYILNWEIATEVSLDAKPIQKQLFVNLDYEEQKLYDYLLKNGKQLLDIVALECDFPVYKVSSILLNMELKGVVRPLPGKLFEAI